MVSTYLHKLSSYLHWFLNALSLRHLQELSDIENIVIKWKKKQKNKTKSHSRKVRLICSLRLPCWKCQNLVHASICTSIKALFHWSVDFFGGEGKNCYISNSLFFLSFSGEIRGGSCYLGWMTKHLFQNSAKVSEVYPIKVH